MTTINEIAKLTGFSTSTVSIVLRGDGKKRSISDETIDKIIITAREKGYTPNTSARRLRISTYEQKPIVAIMWSDDFRTSLMVRFLRGIKSAMINENSDCELRVIPYKPGKLTDVFNESLLLSINAAIVCNASYEDLNFLENNDFNLPLVLYNRNSNKYSSVVADNKKMGKEAFDIFMSHNKKSLLVLDDKTLFPGKEDRAGTFIKLAKDSGLNVETIICEENTASSSYDACDRNIQKIKEADAMFATSDIIALGALKVIYKHDISVPKDIEIISIGVGDPEMCDFWLLSPSTIELPMEEMAKMCLITLMEQIYNYTSDPKIINVDVDYVERETCHK